jgi:hypothetical protein
MTAGEPGRRPTALHCVNTLSALVIEAAEPETETLSIPWRSA